MGGCHLVTTLRKAFDLVTHGLDLLSAILSPSSVLIDIMIVHFQVDGRRQTLLDFYNCQHHCYPSSSLQKKGNRQKCQGHSFSAFAFAIFRPPTVGSSVPYCIVQAAACRRKVSNMYCNNVIATTYTTKHHVSPPEFPPTQLTQNIPLTPAVGHHLTSFTVTTHTPPRPIQFDDASPHRLSVI